MSQYFNEYGNLTHPLSKQLEDTISDMVDKHLTKLREEGISPLELRAVIEFLAGSIQTTGAFHILRLQWAMQAKNVRKEMNA
jgi:hypothetical protein